MAWIDPDLLGVKNEGIVCVICTGVMVDPSIGCSGPHSFCRGCYVKVLEKKKECPTRRYIVDTIPPQGIGAICLISDGMAPIPNGESYS